LFGLTRARFPFGRSAGGAARFSASVLGAFVAGLFLIASGTFDARAADIPALERQLINPCENCGGMPLAGSYCGGAMKAKQELRDLAAQGMTDQQILDAFVAKYGTWILATPPRRGFTLLAWILPMLGIVVGGGGLALFLKRARASGLQRAGSGSHVHERESSVRDRAGKDPSLRTSSKEAPAAMSDAARAQYRDMLRRELGEV